MPSVSATSPLPTRAFSITLVNNATVYELDPAPFGNTKEILILNTDTTNAVYVQCADVTAGLPAAGAVLITNSTVIPAGMAVSFNIGPEGDRNALNTVAYWAAATGPGSNLQYVVRSAGGANIVVNITYINCTGGGGMD